MTAVVGNALTDLANELQSSCGNGTITELTQFPSGGAMLDVHRDDGRLFVLAYSPSLGFGVDEVQGDDGMRTGYRFAYRELGPAANKLRELVCDQSPCNSPGPPLALSLVVIQAKDLSESKRFYETLGLNFQSEKHGSGPPHFSAVVGPTVFELYPCRVDSHTGQLRVGFEVPLLDRTLELLRRRAATIRTEPHDSPWGRRAVIEDPDGNRIELTERKAT